MEEKQKQALINKLTAMADDELILAHRDSEWTGHAPLLEEDIALANLAQDELGHATTLYGILKELTGQEPDQMAFFRDASAYRNVQMVELPKGDWAFTMLRQYLFDAYEHVLYTELQSSAFQPLQDFAAKVIGEELYHLRHSHMWVERLGLGTNESNLRMQNALSILWPLTSQLFQASEDDHLLIDSKIIPDPAPLHDAWKEIVKPHMANCNLAISTHATMLLAPRTEHTNHLAQLLKDMQQVARWDPKAEW